MEVTLQRAGSFEPLVRAFRADVAERIGFRPDGAAVEPLPYGFYLFLDDAKGGDPAGMAEFYFYDDAFSDYRSSVYHRASDLSTIAPMREIIHVRTLHVRSEDRRSARLMYLIASLVDLANEFGARFLTAGRCVDCAYGARLRETSGMRKLGTYELDGALQQLSLLELEPVALRARRLTQRARVTIERSVAADLEQRRSRARSQERFVSAN